MSDARRDDRLRQCLCQSAESMFALIGEGMVVTDTTPRILAANPAFTRITGYTEDEVKGHNPSIFKSGRHPLAFYQQMWRSLMDQGCWRGEVWNRRKNGEIYPEWLTIQAIRDEQGETRHYLAVFTDLSQAKREQELEEARQAAEDAAHAKARFLANMSHEIRTPLTAIIGFAESMIDSHQTLAERAHAVDTIIRNGRHLQSLVNNILDLSKVKANRIDLEYLETYLPDLLAGMVELARAKIDEDRNLELEVHYLPPLPLRIRTDPTRVRQILINLLDNAIKFTETGTVRLIVSFTPELEQLVIAVQDTGIGIAEDRLATLFEPFSQGDSSTTRRFGGTGLGLSIAKELAELLGGNIQVTSTLGLGSMFVATLATGPEAPENLVWDNQSFDAAYAARPIRATRPLALMGKVLIADDNRANQDLISLYVRRCGLQPVIAENGQDAVEKAQLEAFDLVLMDMQMPVMDGFDATTLLRLTGFDQPVVALSANVAQSDIEAALAAGCNAYLSKPINLDAFFQMLAHYLPPGESAQSTPDLTGGIPDDDPELQRLHAAFLAELPARMAIIRNARMTQDWKTLRVQAHQIKGVGTNFGMPELTRLAGALEFQLLRGDLIEVTSLIEDLEKLWPS